MRITIQAICCLVIATMSCAYAHAGVVIARYEFDNTDGINRSEAEDDMNMTGFFDATFSDPDLMDGGFTSGVGIDPDIIGNRDILFASLGNGISPGTNDDLAGAISAGDYFSVTLSANPGFVLDLDYVVFDVGRELNGTQDYALFSSVGGFAAGQEIVFANNSIPVAQVPVMQGQVSLAGPQFDGLSSIEFRLVFDDRFDDSGTSSGVYIDNFTVTGMLTAVPEPSTFTIVVVGLFGILIRRRRFANA